MAMDDSAPRGNEKERESERERGRERYEEINLREGGRECEGECSFSNKLQ